MKDSQRKAMFARLYGYKNKTTGKIVQYFPFRSKKDAELTRRLQRLENLIVVRLTENDLKGIQREQSREQIHRYELPDDERKLKEVELEKRGFFGRKGVKR